MFRRNAGIAVLAALLAGFSGIARGDDAPTRCGECARACDLVRGFGQGEGGRADIGFLVDLNMRGWKPQSTRGIEILGWSAVPQKESQCLVYYTYREREEISLVWRVDIRSGDLTPLTSLTERIQKMAEYYRETTTRSKESSEDDRSEPNRWRRVSPCGK